MGFKWRENDENPEKQLKHNREINGKRRRCQRLKIKVRLVISIGELGIVLRFRWNFWSNFGEIHDRNIFRSHFPWSWEVFIGNRTLVSENSTGNWMLQISPDSFVLAQRELIECRTNDKKSKEKNKKTHD